MDYSNKLRYIYLATGSILVFLGTLWFFKKYKQPYVSLENIDNSSVDYQLNYKPGFLPSHQGLYFQGMPPSLKVENDYHSYILTNRDDGGCDGDYEDFECRQKAYLKAMKAGSTDKADLICYKHRNDENEYYACLDSVYGNHMWMDRYVGTNSCVCPGDNIGIERPDGSCLCPQPRPLHDRRPVDGNDHIVDRVGY